MKKNIYTLAVADTDKVLGGVHYVEYLAEPRTMQEAVEYCAGVIDKHFRHNNPDYGTMYELELYFWSPKADVVPELAFRIWNSNTPAYDPARLQISNINPKNFI